MMTIPPLPPISQVRMSLHRLNHRGLQALAEKCGVGFMTLVKIRCGQTQDPGYSTVRKLEPYVDALAALPAYQSREQRLRVTAEAEARAAAKTAPEVLG